MKTLSKKIGQLACGAAMAGIMMASSAMADGKNVAYLSASSANTWLSTSKVAMDEIAKANDITITEFDAQFDSAKQTAQVQDAIASGKYDGMVIVSLNGAGSIPDVEAALEAGLKVVVMNQIIGADLTTSDPQVDGIHGSVLAAPFRSGTRMGELTVKACEGIDPCKAVYIFGIKGIPLDNALRAGFDEVIAKHPNIKIVAEAEGKYAGPDGGMKATQDVLQIAPDFDVMIGADQSMQGAAIVLADEDKAGDVKLIGLGGSSPALKGIKDGTWFGTVYGAPLDEGRLAMDIMVKALASDEKAGGVDPISDLPDGGLVTKENVDKFSAQWDG